MASFMFLRGREDSGVECEGQEMWLWSEDAEAGMASLCDC
jgi:hypothetical protein